jgi:hypothetical protein
MRSHAERALGQGRCRLSPPATEFVVYADIYHLDVSVVATKLIVRREATDCRWNCKAVAAEPNKIVLESRRPIPQERPFRAEASVQAQLLLLVEMVTGAPSTVKVGLFDPTQAPPPFA